MKISSSSTMSDGVMLTEIRVDLTTSVEGQKLSTPYSTYRMIQLTDLHVGMATSDRHLAKIASLVRHLAPSLIFLTGDYVQVTLNGRSYAENIFDRPSLALARKHRPKLKSALRSFSQFLNDITPSDGFIGTFGNHDHKGGRWNIRESVRDIPVTWLSDSSLSFMAGHTPVRISGLRDYREDTPDLARALENNVGWWNEGRIHHHPPTHFLDAVRSASAQKRTPFHIVLSHNPDAIAAAPEPSLLRSALVLCGHTHGGQVCLPNRKPLLTFTKHGRYLVGLTESENGFVYTSRGVGFGGVALRLFCPPEIVTVDILSDLPIESP